MTRVDSHRGSRSPPSDGPPPKARPVDRAMAREESPNLLGPLAVGIAVVGAIVMLYFALFPFDFVDQGRSPIEVLRRFSLNTGPPWALREVPANILLTVPLGFG